jgi:hypothetical protein
VNRSAESRTDLSSVRRSFGIADPSVSRKVYLVLSPRSLPYARRGLQSLLLKSLDCLDIVLITDTAEDRTHLERVVRELENPQAHAVRVVAEGELADSESAVFGARANLRSFRHGHPCWRKITDPLLIGPPGEEIVILDPDLYFPNRFRFEPTPSHGLLLMWQRPNCLLPPEVVKAAMGSRISLARHVDIGVAHWRASADLDWLDWMLGKLGGTSLPRAMHVEAIVWAAIAMREGGGHLDPRYWRCWRRTAAKRILRKLGVGGRQVLQSEPWRSIKCFHAGGEAKWWLAEVEQQGISGDVATLSEPGVVHPFLELTPERYEREEARKRLVRRLDVFQLIR